MAIERFDKEAAGWDSNPFIHECSRKAFEAIVAAVQSLKAGQASNLDVLEIGCGTGVLSFMLAPLVSSLTAVDTSRGMTDVLARKIAADPSITNIHPVCALIDDPNDPSLRRAGDGDGSPPRYSLIVCHLTLHHIPDLPSFFRMLHALLAEGGRVALTDYEDFGSEAAKFHPKFKWNDVERHGIKRAEAEVQLKEAGFQSVSVTRAFSVEKDVEGGGDMDFPFLLCLGTKAS